MEYLGRDTTARRWHCDDYYSNESNIITMRLQNYFLIVTLMMGHLWWDTYDGTLMMGHLWWDTYDGTLMMGHLWWDTYDGTLMMGHLCWDTYAGTLMMGHLWWDTYDGTLMMGHLCWDTYDGTLMMGHLWWDTYDGTLMMGHLWCWDIVKRHHQNIKIWCYFIDMHCKYYIIRNDMIYLFNNKHIQSLYTRQNMNIYRMYTLIMLGV